MTKDKDRGRGGPADRIVICGLGGVGRQGAALLRGFGARLVGVDLAAPDEADAALFDEFFRGDCARAGVLKKAGAERARAILLLTADERANIAAAIAARALNPLARLVIRSGQEQLNRLLADQLGNLIAFEPHEFSTLAFAVIGLNDETRARFEIGGASVRVLSHVATESDWSLGRRLAELNSPSRRMIGHFRSQQKLGDLLDLTSSESEILVDDVLTYVDCGEFFQSAAETARRAKTDWRPRRWLERAQKLLRAAPKAFFFSLAVMLAMAGLGVWLYRAENPDISWFDAMNVAVVLAVGGFDNVFGALKAPFPISPGLYAYSLAMKILSSIFLGIIFAVMTEQVLSARFQIAARRPEPPLDGHSLVVGLGPLGQNIAECLKRWGRATVGVSTAPVPENILAGLPLVVGPIEEALRRAHILGARSVVVVGEDQVENLETALLAHKLNPQCAIAFRVADRDLADSVAALIPAATGLSDAEIAAEAITGAAYDETILTAFHLAGKSVLVAEYEVAKNPSLIGRRLAEIAYGYGAIPVSHSRRGEAQLNPSDDIRLESDDRLVVLATVDALRRIERENIAPPRWRLTIKEIRARELAFDAGNLLSRIAGCDLFFARKALNEVPVTLETPLYRPQGLRLIRELAKIMVHAELHEAAN